MKLGILSLGWKANLSHKRPSNLDTLDSPSFARSGFQHLPLEIRWKIYNYLLLEENVLSTTGSKRLRANFTISLFRVSKQISAESLEFFYNENIFLSLETNEKRLYKIFQKSIPMIHYENELGHKLPGLACSIQYMGFHNDTTPYRCKCAFAILTARSLPNLVHLLNIDHSLPEYGVGHIELTLEFPRRSNTTTYSQKALDHAFDGFNGIRKTPDSIRRSLRFEMKGILKEEKRIEIETTFARPAFTRSELMDISLQARDRGQASIRAGDYAAARGEYAICTFVLKRLESQWDWGRQALKSDTLTSLAVDVHLDMSLVESAQDFYDDGIWRAEKAWEMAFAGTDPFGKVADLKFSLGVALAAAGRYEDAMGALTHACSFDPKNEVMRTMLESLKVYVEEQKRESEGQGPAGGAESLKRWFEIVMVERRSRICPDASDQASIGQPA